MQKTISLRGRSFIISSIERFSKKQIERLEYTAKKYLESDMSLFFASIYVEMDAPIPNVIMRVGPKSLFREYIVLIQPSTFEYNQEDFFTHFTHEVVHLIDSQLTQSNIKWDEKRNRLYQALEIEKYADETPTSDSIRRVLRIYLLRFQDEVRSEGLAMFGMNYLKLDADAQSWVTSSEESFNSYYKLAITSAEKIKEQWENILVVQSDIRAVMTTIEPGNSNSFYGNLRTFSYTIGAHIVHALLFLNPKLTFYDIVKMESAKFMMEYEKAMLDAGKTPVVSYASSSGIFSYGGAIAELTAWKT